MPGAAPAARLFGRECLARWPKRAPTRPCVHPSIFRPLGQRKKTAVNTNVSSPTTEVEASTIRVLIPSQLWSYTADAKQVDISIVQPEAQSDATLANALAELDRRFPGLRFRIIDEQGKIRPHIKLFVNGELARDLAVALSARSEVMIVGALSGG